MTQEQLMRFPGVREMCETDAFKVMMAYLRDHCPFVGNDSVVDPNALIRNEGRMQGWFQLVNVATNIHRSQKPAEPESATRSLYKDPNPRNPEQNKQ